MPKNPRPERPFNLVDGMILIAATCLGLAYLQAMPHLSPGGLADYPTLREKIGRAIMWVLYLLMPWCFPWAGAVVVIRLRPPRPPWRRLALQPGFAACVAGVGAMGGV